MSHTDPVQSLVDLGFTGLEAEVYAYLLRESPATGYRVAQALGKPTANTYKAIESLQTKGAVMVDEGSTRVCRAVPTTEFLARLEREFADRRRRADRALATLQRESRDDRVYQLRSHEQVLERFRSMLAECRQIALIDIFPEPLEALRKELEARAKDIVIVAQVYRPVEIVGVETVCSARGEQILEGWPGQQLNIVTDASEYMLALLEPGTSNVLQAVWSRSTYLSCLYHSGLAGEISLVRVESALETATTVDAVRKVATTRPSVVTGDIPGYHELVRRYGHAIPVAHEEK